ncbi:MAG TPA: metalloregulator ArsR/SmtB family transcription factor [Opitutus sp.]|nr:metalloregulator ArsR/SmtB family transcription factor [Opitutus sp.]
MELVRIYECLCDLTRLRLLAVLADGPLCVCHFQAVLKEPQVKISKHLGYLRERGLVQAERRGNWIVYSLPPKRSRELEANLACLQDCAEEHAVFQKDRARLRTLAPEVVGESSCGCKKAPAGRTGRAKRPRKAAEKQA